MRLSGQNENCKIFFSQCRQEYGGKFFLNNHLMAIYLGTVALSQLKLMPQEYSVESSEIA